MPLLLEPNIGKKIANYLILFCIIINFALIFFNDCPPTAMFFYQATQYRAGRNLCYEQIFIKFYTRMSTYIIGIILGYNLANDSTPKFLKIRFIYIIFALLLTLFGLFPCNYDSDSLILYVYSLLYGCLHRPIFGFCTAYIIFYLNTDSKFSHFNSFCDCKIIKILSYLSYGAYLVQLGPITASFTLTKYSHHYYNIFIHTFRALLLAALSFLMSFIFVTLPIEFPFNNLFKLLT